MPPIYRRAVGLCVWLILFPIAVIPQKDADILRAGHTAKMNEVAFSPDGGLLASAGSDAMLIVWNTATGAEKWSLRADAESSEVFTSVAFSPDGKILAVGTSNLLRILTAQTGKEITTLAEDYAGIESVAFSSDGKMLAAASGFAPSPILASLGISDLKNKAGIWSVANFEEIQTFEDALAPVAFNRAGTQLATAGSDSTIKLWNTKTGRVARTIKQDGKIDSLSFNPAGTVLLGVIGDAFGLNIGGMQIGMWKVLNGTTIKIPDDTSTTGPGLFTPDGKSIVIGDAYPTENGLILLSSLNGKPSGGFGSLFKAGDAGVFSPNGKYLAAVDASGYDIHIFDFQKKSLLRTLKGHSINVTSVAFIDDGKNVLGGYDDGTVIWWDTSTAKAKAVVSAPREENEFMPAASGGNKVFVSPNGKYFADEDHGISFFETKDGQALSETSTSADFWFSPDGTTAVSISDETITLRDVPSGKVLSRFAHQFSEIPYGTTFLALSFDNKTLAIVINPDIVLYDIAGGKAVKVLQDAGKEGSTAGFSPDGRILVVSNLYDGVIQILNFSTEEVVFELEQKGPYFAFSPDGKSLATVSGYDSLVRFTDLETGEESAVSEAKYDVSDEPVNLRYNRNGSLLAVGGANGIKIFETATAKEVRSMK